MNGLSWHEMENRASLPIPLAAKVDHDGRNLADYTGDLPLLDPADWVGLQEPPREWLWQDYIPHRQATYLTGPGSAGKSLLTQQLCTCVAMGMPLFGATTRGGAAIYVTAEDDADELHRRQKAICASLGVDLRDLSGRLHLVSLVGATDTALLTAGSNADAPGRFTRLYRAIRGVAQIVDARFIALDNVAHLYAGDENSRHEVATFVNALNRLALDVNGSVLFLGHPNKAGAEFSGSTAWENQVRSRLFMARPEPDEGMADPDLRTLERGKANYARKGAAITFRWHQWAFVRDEDLPEGQRGEMAAATQATNDNHIFLHCLDERNRQQRTVSENKASRTYAPKEFAEMPESKRIGRVRLESAMDRLFRIGAIERGFVFRDAGEGKDRYGIRRRSADLSADLPLTGSADLPLTTRRQPPAHTLISKDIDGAPPQAVAPIQIEGARAYQADEIDWDDHGLDDDHDR